MKRTLIGLALVGALVAPAFAQPVPQVGVTWGYTPKITFSAGFIGLVPAASATDIVCIAGSATKTVRVQRLVLSGSAGTLVTVPVALYRRAAADTGGTAASTTANPANNVTSLDTGLAAASVASATTVSYTANPTIGSAGTIIDARSLTLPVTSAGVVSAPLIYDFGKDSVNLLPPLTLRGTAQQACLNLTAVSVSSGVLSGSIVWTEE